MKSTFIIIALCIFLMATTHAQNVGIGTTTPNANAALEIKSNNKGFLMPRLSTTARNNMTNVAKGMLVYDTTRAGFYYHDGGKWLPISQSNNDSLLRFTYPGVAPRINSMILNGDIQASDLYGTLYDNGGQAGSYASNSNDSYTILPISGDSTILIMVEVEQMDLESPYDSIEIYSYNDYDHKQVFTGNRTGIFYFNAAEILYFKFRSNGVNNLSGFKINWTKVTSNSRIAETPPLIGWYFNSAKLAARGGVNINNNWATENLGNYSFAFGQNAVAKGDYSNALGQNNSALGIYCTAIGNGNTSKGFGTTAIGIRNTVSNNYATAIGYGLIAKANFSFVTGYYNDSTANAVFAIGNGVSPTNRSNSLTILGDGNTGIGTTSPTTKLDVDGGIRTKYSGSVIKSVTGTGSAALINLSIPALPAGWDLTNTLVLVSLADGTSGVIYRTKLTSATNIELFFEANATGATRFNYIVFKL
jgi:hypothetical protein